MKICIEFEIFSIFKKYFRHFQLLASKEVEELKQKVIELETANAGKLKDWRKFKWNKLFGIAALVAQNGRIAEESEQLVGHLRTSIVSQLYELATFLLKV